MNLDTKQKVLIAIYTEYQKDLPDMRNTIKASLLGIENQAFCVAIEKLENERLIKGANIAKAKGRALAIYTDSIMMTPEGIEYVENKLGIEKSMSGVEKVQEMTKKSVAWGWNEFKDITVQVLAEMGKHGMDKILGKEE
ncbi:MAG: YjcQ family protein [Romboutsia sp.]